MTLCLTDVGLFNSAGKCVSMNSVAGGLQTLIPGAGDFSLALPTTLRVIHRGTQLLREIRPHPSTSCSSSETLQRLHEVFGGFIMWHPSEASGRLLRALCEPGSCRQLGFATHHPAAASRAGCCQPEVTPCSLRAGIRDGTKWQRMMFGEAKPFPK